MARIDIRDLEQRTGIERNVPIRPTQRDVEHLTVRALRRNRKWAAKLRGWRP